MKHCAPRDPQRVPKPKYETTAQQARLNIGYPNSATGSMYNRTALLTGEVTRKVGSDLDGNRGTKNETLCPERPTEGPQTQIRSHSTAGASLDMFYVCSFFPGAVT